MTDREILELLTKIDDGYKPTEKEKKELACIEKISWWEIEKIPESIGKLTSLLSLNLSETQISTLPESIRNLTRLQNLNLRYTVIGALPESIWSLTSLQRLILRFTKISTLPENIGNLLNLQDLDLSSTKISILPESIGNLIHLQSLNLSSTQISSLPESIENLTNLQSLDMRSTQISALPESIGNLPSLQNLDLRFTQISELPESIGNLKSLQSLELRQTQISTLPKSLGNLMNLQKLNLSSAQISTLPESIGNLTSLQRLNLNTTKISMLPESIGNLKSLKILDLRSTKITMLPESIGNLTSLKSLDLRSSQISTFPESIGSLTSLQNLELKYAQIRALPENIGTLMSLQNIDLSSTKISRLPESIGNLTSLKSLDLSSTKINSLSESIGNLTNLQSLDLRYTQISELPKSIGNLTSLQSLDLRYTQISKLPESIGNLKSLQNLYLSSTQISTLPESIGNLTKLQALFLNTTQIRSLPESIWNLTNIQILFLGSTQIRSLPESIGNLTNLKLLYMRKLPICVLPLSLGILPKLKRLVLEDITLPELPKELLSLNLEYKDKNFNILKKDQGIYIHGLRLKRQPISLFYQPREFIVDYYKQPKIDINETKIIFLGSEGVGKTHTIKRILNDNHKISETLKETPGISIASKAFDTDECSYRINFWDFGGQEIMHAMHRCFLTDRTGYVVVVSTRFGDVNKQARYWLKNIESFTKGAPVVVYVNIWSEGTYYQIDEVSLRRDYPNVIDVKQCSAKDGDDAEFSEVVKAIQEMALANDSIAMSFPVSWEKVRQEIIALGGPGSQKYYISQQEFREKCQMNGIENRDIQSWLLEWFNDLGECFSYKFKDKNPSPDKDLKILNPEWLTNAIYIVIREGRSIAEDGVISHERIHNKLDRSDKGTMRNVSYTETECDYILEVMRKFRLSYRVPGMPEEFIPVLLREKMPTDLKTDGYKKMISYEMKYKYLPENVIHNLMIQMYPYLDRYHCWRKGVVIDTQEFLNFGLLAVLDMSRDDEILRINVYSYADHEPWQLLQEIRSALLGINSSLNLEAAEYIIIGSGSASERVSVEKLLKLKKRGKTYYEGDDKDYHINELLSDTFGEAQVRNIELYGKDETDGRGILRNGPVEYVLKEMKADLVQTDNERLFSHAGDDILTCDKLCEYLISACAQIQSNPKYWNEKEDSRSTQVRTILRNRGIFVSDQTLYGHAKDSDNPGEVDLMIMKDTTDPLTIVEAMNIDSVNKKYIQDHLNKLLDDYNPSGLPELFLVAYVQKAKTRFQSFWKNYLGFVDGTDAGDFRFKSIDERETNNHYIKHAVTEYSCDSAKFTVHHICMRAGG